MRYTWRNVGKPWSLSHEKSSIKLKIIIIIVFYYWVPDLALSKRS